MNYANLLKIYLSLAWEYLKAHPELALIPIAGASFPIYKKVMEYQVPSNDLTPYVVKSMKLQGRISERGKIVK